MLKNRSLQCLLLGVAATFITPSLVRACSCSNLAFDRAEPRDGAQDVALNAALEIMGAFQPDSVRLEDDVGQSVDITLYAGPTPGCPGTAAELVPKQPLRPHTNYTVKVKSLYADPVPTALTFTTGSHLLADPEPASPLHAQASMVFDVPTAGSICAFHTIYACVGVDDWKDVELVARRGEEVILRWTLLASDGAIGLAEMPDCLEFRRRTPTGRRSSPLTICGDALEARPAVETDLEQHALLCRDGVIGRPTGDGVPTPSEPDKVDEGDDAGEATRLGTSSVYAAGPRPERESGSCSAAFGTRARGSWASAALLALAALAIARGRARVAIGSAARAGGRLSSAALTERGRRAGGAAKGRALRTRSCPADTR